MRLAREQCKIQEHRKGKQYFHMAGVWESPVTSLEASGFVMVAPYFTFIQDSCSYS